MKRTRKGFTLVELLIVIVVIGILSAMMMFSSTEAATSAKASNIISNMRQLKTATIAWYTENLDSVVATGKTGKNESRYKIKKKSNNAPVEFSQFVHDNSAEILTYISNGNSIKIFNKKDAANNDGCYILTAMDLSRKWYVCYNVGNNTRLKEKLAGKAKSAGLLGANQLSGNASGVDGDVSNHPIGSAYSNQKFVCMFILSLAD